MASGVELVQERELLGRRVHGGLLDGLDEGGVLEEDGARAGQGGILETARSGDRIIGHDGCRKIGGISRTCCSMRVRTGNDQDGDRTLACKQTKAKENLVRT